MRQLLIALLFTFNAVPLCAQGVLTLPDLAALTGQQSAGSLSVDPRSGSIYVSNASRLSGMRNSGLARLVNGVPDLSWRPALTGSVLSRFVFAPNQSMYYVGSVGAASNGPSILNLSTAVASEPVVRYTPKATATVQGFERLQAVAGGHDHWLYFTGRESFVDGVGTSRIGRLDTRDHTLDSWTYEVSGSTAFPVVGADGSVFVVASSFAFDGEMTRSITRLTTGAAAQPIWQRELQHATPRIEGDVQGRLYVMTQGARGPYAGIVRIAADGALDPTWSSFWVDAVFSQSTLASGADMQVVGDGLVITVTPGPFMDAVAPTIARIDASGGLSARITAHDTETTASPYFLSRRLLGATHDTIYFATNRTITLLDPQTLRQKRSIAYAAGGAAQIFKVLALPDGGRLICGVFDAFYGGRRYRDVLRIGADGNVVQDWRLAVEGTVDDVFLTPRGIVLFGRMTKVNGVLVSNGATPLNGYFRPSVALVSLSSGAAVDPAWGAQWPTTGGQPAYDGADTFFVGSSVAANASSLALQTLSVKTNAMSAAWSIPVRDEYANLDVDQLGGLWLFWEGSDFGGSKVHLIERLDVARRTQTASISVTQFSLQARSLLSTRQHAYITDQRFALTQGGVADPSWRQRSPASASGGYPLTLSANYVYWTQSGGDGNFPVLRRSPLTGNGDADPSWSSLLSSGVFTKYPQPPSTDDIEYVSYSQADPELVATRNLPTENKTVIEYFNRDVGRYFLTGRPDEQHTLDARSESFARTGMQFQARGTQAYADEQSAPVCRMYAAPDRGGSNTHFFGTGDDCAVLNTVTALRFEGFDFAATKPVASTCPANAPNAIFRLFNNKSASNQGNHRYVVSVATKSRMIAQGWVDEGVVFCSTSVTDAVN
jgi:hypothetical protein